MNKERLEMLRTIHAYGDPRISENEVQELFDEIDRLRDSFQWIKLMENDFYNEIQNGSFFDGSEIRRLNKTLLGYSGQFSSLFGTVNEALNPKYT